MGNPIPQAQRDIVRLRDRGLCVRCGMPGTDWHHRRSRRVRDDHTHCSCVGVWSCRTCHRWIHAHPDAAITAGLIVSQWVTDPWTVPFESRGMTLYADCSGGLSQTLT